MHNKEFKTSVTLLVLYSVFDFAVRWWCEKHIMIKHIMVSGVDNCWFCSSCLRQCSDLVYLILLASVHSLWIWRRPQPELGVTEVAVSINVVQTLPDDLLLCQETLVCNQEVQLALQNKQTLTYCHSIHTDTWVHTHTICIWLFCVWFYVHKFAAEWLQVNSGYRDVLSGGYRSYMQLCLHWQQKTTIWNTSEQAPLPLLQITGKVCPSCSDTVSQLLAKGLVDVWYSHVCSEWEHLRPAQIKDSWLDELKFATTCNVLACNVLKTCQFTPVQSDEMVYCLYCNESLYFHSNCRLFKIVL